MKKLAIIGASYLQAPLIQKAKEMGLETHVFAWAANDVGEKIADFFYPVSIVEKDTILEKCRKIGIDGVCSIASDLASVTVNYIAAAMGLVGNSLESAYLSTNKHAMRECFERGGDPSPKSRLIKSAKDLEGIDLDYPLIVKPTDRSGSRGITLLDKPDGIKEAVQTALNLSFEKTALVEEYAAGQEYSVECISYQGNHRFLALTKKYTTGAPHFIETAHLQPAPVSEKTLERVKQITFHALDSLKIVCGASHTELKIADNGAIRLIEIGGRMGGGCIGSDLVPLSTGIDFVKAVIEIALDNSPDLSVSVHFPTSAIRFILSETDMKALEALKREHPDYLIRKSIRADRSGEVTDDSNRFGYFLMAAKRREDLLPYLPKS